MPVLNSVLAIAAVLDLVVSVTEVLTEFQTLVRRAQAEGRDLTPDEVAGLVALRQKAFDQLQNTA